MISWTARGIMKARSGAFYIQVEGHMYDLINIDFRRVPGIEISHHGMLCIQRHIQIIVWVLKNMKISDIRYPTSHIPPSHLVRPCYLKYLARRLAKVPITSVGCYLGRLTSSDVSVTMPSLVIIGFNIPPLPLHPTGLQTHSHTFNPALPFQLFYTVDIIVLLYHKFLTHSVCEWDDSTACWLYSWNAR